MDAKNGVVLGAVEAVQGSSNDIPAEQIANALGCRGSKFPGSIETCGIGVRNPSPDRP